MQTLEPQQPPSVLLSTTHEVQHPKTVICPPAPVCLSQVSHNKKKRKKAPGKNNPAKKSLRDSVTFVPPRLSHSAADLFFLLRSKCQQAGGD